MYALIEILSNHQLNLYGYIYDRIREIKEKGQMSLFIEISFLPLSLFLDLSSSSL